MVRKSLREGGEDKMVDTINRELLRLRKEKVQLLKIIAKNKQMAFERQRIKQETAKLKREVREIKELAKNGVRTKIRRVIAVAKSPTTKRRARNAIRAFQAFADRVAKIDL